MTLKEWQIWHTYSTFIDSSDIDLSLLGYELVKEGIAAIVVFQGGATLWKNEERMLSGHTYSKPANDGNKATFNMDGPLELMAGFQLECWAQACASMHFESKVFGYDSDIPHKYLRAYIGEVEIQSEELDVSLLVYPILTVYVNGVVIVELRTLSPAEPMEHTRFIDDCINVYSKDFETILAPPGLARLTPIASHYFLTDSSFIIRLKQLIAARLHKIAIRQRTQINESGDFTFESAPIASYEEGSETFTALGELIVDVTAYLVARRSCVLAYLLFGAKRESSNRTPWTSRPHVHILSFDRQDSSAIKNLSDHKVALRSMFARVSLSDDLRHQLPESSRLADDFLSFIGSHLTMRVWSMSDDLLESSMKQQLVIEQQAINNLLDYVHMLHNMILFRALKRKVNRQQVWSLQRQLLTVENQISSCARSGEIRALYNESWRVFDIDGMRRRTQELLALIDHEKQQHQSEKNEVVGRLLVIVFGLSALLPVTKAMINSTAPSVAAQYTEWLSILLALTLVWILTFITTRLVKRKYDDS